MAHIYQRVEETCYFHLRECVGMYPEYVILKQSDIFESAHYHHFST